MSLCYADCRLLCFLLEVVPCSAITVNSEAVEVQTEVADGLLPDVVDLPVSKGYIEQGYIEHKH